MTETYGATFPDHQGHYYGGQWHSPTGGRSDIVNPSTGITHFQAADGTAEDAAKAIKAAQAGYDVWRKVPPLERAARLRAAAQVIRSHAQEFALLDAVDAGNPLKELAFDTTASALLFDFFAGLVTEMKGVSIPMGPNAINFTVREPRGVVARLIAYNHPFLFAAAKAAAPLAAGNAVIMKPAEQAPLSALRLAELIGGIFPPGVFNVITGGRDVGGALASSADVAMVGLIGSVPTGRAIMVHAAQTIKPSILELGGKNALIACSDADPALVAQAMVKGMNFGWCGQSCGSTSRAFLHADIYDAVIAKLAEYIQPMKPGLPWLPATTMGALISKVQHDKVLSYIKAGHEDGAKLICGGDRPKAAELASGYFVNPTVFGDVTQDMRIAREEIFGPVLSVLKWTDETAMLKDVNSVEYGLTGSVWTNDISRGHRLASEIQSGYVWINEVSSHFIGAPFGGYKQSGLGREESIDELLAFTQVKNVHVKLTAN